MLHRPHPPDNHTISPHNSLFLKIIDRQYGKKIRYLTGKTLRQDLKNADAMTYKYQELEEIKGKIWIQIKASSPQQVRNADRTSPSFDRGKTFTKDNTITITPMITANIRASLVICVIKILLHVGLLQRLPQYPPSSYPLL